MRETLYGRIKAVRALIHSAITTNTNTDGVSVNLDQSGADFRTATLVGAGGAWTDGVYTLTPQESPDGSTWTNIPAARLQGSGVINAANQVVEIGVTPDPGTYPFLRVRVVSTGVTAGAAMQALWLLGSPSSFPVVRP